MSVTRFTATNFYLLIALLVFALTAIYNPTHSAASVKSGATTREIIDITQPPTVPDGPNYDETALSLARGGSLSNLLLSDGHSAADVFDIVNSLSQILDMRKILAGQKILVKTLKDGRIEEVELKVNYDRTVRTRYDGNAWRAEEDITDTYSIPKISVSTIESSLFEAARNSGVPASVVMELIGLLSFNVDFQRDIKPGDRLITLYEKLYSSDDEYMTAGNLIYARLEGRMRDVEFWQYTRLDGKTDHYDSSGKSVKRTLLKTPVDGARISSGFGYRRIPALNFAGLHYGIDFAVRSGTPVMAAGDGRVLIAGWHNSYGLRVKLSHANHYDTMYAHLSKIAAGVHVGARMKQGQIIGYVGSTGISTGPHCHYEVHYYGTPVNPVNLQFPPEHWLDSEDIARLNSKIDVLSAQFGL